jgi:hypothetical protein
MESDERVTNLSEKTGAAENRIENRAQLDAAFLSLLRRQSRSPSASRARIHLRRFLRAAATPEPTEEWSLTTLKERLMKIGAKVVGLARYAAFQMATAISRDLFTDILRMVAALRPPPITSTA